MMQRISVKTGSPYEVLIGRGLIADSGKYALERVKPCKAALITDDSVGALYGDTVEKSFSEAGFNVCRITVAHGESSKNMDTLSDVLEQLAQNRLTRSDIVLALGGGMIGDLAGFVAAVYLRGIRFIQLPTSFLAAIDSSVGGKTAVDLKGGKNLAGAFWQPEMVICDIDLLGSLTKDIFLDGVGEAVKYGFAFDKELFEMMAGGIDDKLPEVVARCVSIKSRVVEEDEFDNGERRKLNFGHTFGHAVEHCSSFSISHGQAVGIGMVIMTRACVNHGLIGADALETLISVMKKCGLPTECSFGAAELCNAALGDKKRRGNKLHIVVPVTIGESDMKEIEVAELESWIASGL